MDLTALLIPYVIFGLGAVALTIIVLRDLHWPAAPAALVGVAFGLTWPALAAAALGTGALWLAWALLWAGPRDIYRRIALGRWCVLAVVLVAFAACRSPLYKKCIDAGGHVENINCRQESYTTTVCHSAGTGKHSVSICVPQTNYYTTCDETCVGANPEAK